MAPSDASFLDGIDWHRPWLLPLYSVAELIIHSADWRKALNHAAAAKGLRNHRNLRIQFVPQSQLPPGIGYEAYISETGCVPTRGNLHDFFNALVWLSFPCIKMQLNALQAAEIMAASNTAQPGSGQSHRGKVRDAATIFDENAALFITSDKALPEALRQHCWQDVFVKHRQDFGQSYGVELFGHALMEKLVSPYKAITAHAWIAVVDESFFALPPEGKRLLLDSQVSQALKQGLSTADFTPLPVLGIPEWWPVQDASFYEDVSVFRPKRLGRNKAIEK